MPVFSGVVTKIRKVTESGWAAFVLDADGLGIVGAAGMFPDVKKGLAVELSGELEHSDKWGDQIRVDSGRVLVRAGVDGAIGYLSSGLVKGVGKKLAVRIVGMFGEKTLDIIRDRPELLSSVPGISEKKASGIAEAFAKTLQYAEIYDLFHGKITRGQAKKILDKYGEMASEVISRNPYVLIEDIDGFGFKRADAMAAAYGIEKDAAARIRAGIVFALDEAAQFGDCYMKNDELVSAAVEVLLPPPVFSESARTQKAMVTDLKSGVVPPGIDPDNRVSAFSYMTEYSRFLRLIQEEIEKMISGGALVKDDEAVYYEKMYCLEASLAKALAVMSEKPPLVAAPEEAVHRAVLAAETENGITFAAAQKRAVSCAMGNRVSVITGGPGRGKTTIIKAVIAAWEDASDGGRVVLCAPTGKAAKRMTETTGVQAYTIHMILAMDLDLSGALLIADESSMLDVRLADKLVRQAEGAQICFVGDADQLPPIGPGLFFRDLISSEKIPYVRLAEGFRASGLIAQNAELVLAGSYAVSLGESFGYVPCEKEDVLSKVLSVYAGEREKYGEAEVCVLVPMKKYAYGVAAINEEIRAKYNPHGAVCPGGFFRVGDRVMQIRNNYHLEWNNEDGEEGQGVFNGECGKIIAGDGDECVVAFDDGRVVRYAEEDVSDLTLAWALTIHKSQGSEYKSVIIVVSKAHYYMLNRSLFYTAMTRARKQVMLVGDRVGVRRAIQNNEEKKRNTRLSARLKKPGESVFAKVDPVPMARMDAQSGQYSFVFAGR